MNSKQAQHLLKLRGIEISEDDSLLTMVALQDVVFANMQGSYTSIDAMQSILRSKGIRVKDDDPLFTLLTLNSILLDESKSKLRLRSNSQKIKLVWAPTVAIAGIWLFIGMLLGTPNTIISPAFVTSFAVFLGAALGVTGLLIYRCEDKNKTVNETIDATTSQPSAWTENEFNLVSKRTQIDDSALLACKDVLIRNSTISEAASKQKIFAGQVQRSLKTLEEKR